MLFFSQWVLLRSVMHPVINKYKIRRHVMGRYFEGSLVLFGSLGNWLITTNQLQGTPYKKNNCIFVEFLVLCLLTMLVVDVMIRIY